MADSDDLPSLDTLQNKIQTARHEDTPGSQASQAASEKVKKARTMRGPADIIAGIAVGGFLGYQLDAWLNTKPAFVIIGIFFGMAAGIMNIYRSALVEDTDEDGTAGE